VSGLLDRLARVAVDHRAAVIALYLALSLLLAWSSASIRLETSLAELLPRGTPSADDFQLFLRAGGSLDRLFISVGREERVPKTALPPEGDGTVLLAGAAEDLAARLRASGLVKEVRYGVGEEDLDRLTLFAVDHLPVLLEEGKVDAVAARLAPSAIRAAVADLKRRAAMPGFVGPIKDIAARDPLGLLPLLGLRDRLGATVVRPDPETGLFLSTDGRHLLIIADPVRPPTEIDFSRRLLAEVDSDEEKVRARSGGGLLFENAGGHLFALEDERRVRHDAAFTSLFSFAGVGLIYLFVVRRPALWVAILVPLVMATVWTLGLAAIYPGRLNMVTVAFAAVLLGIGDDAMLHIYLREREERAAGVRAPGSAVAAMRATGPAAVLATLATAAAFLSLSFVRFRGLAELGIIGAIGMTTLLAGVIFFFPAALAYLGEREARDPAPSIRLPVGALLGLNRWATERKRGVLIAFAILSGAMLVAAVGVHVSTDLRSIRGEDPAAAAMERLFAPYGTGASVETMVVIHGSGEDIEGGLRAASALESFCREGIASKRLTGCESPAASMPPETLQRARFEKIASLPWEAAVATLQSEARDAGMNEKFLAPFTDAALGYSDFASVKIDPDLSRFGALGVPSTSIFFRDPSQAIGIAASVRSRLAGFPTRIASVALVSADLSRILAEDFGRAAWIVGVVITLLMLVAFRRVRLSLLTLLPVAAGCVWMLGTARLLGLELNLMSLMGMPVVFGLGVDFGVYVVDRWAKEGGDGRAALAGVGPAVLVTGLTTLAGFAALLSADLAGLRSLGFAVVAGSGYTLIAALVVLPLMLPVTRRREEAE
jgi:predicted RND superfamily exporter protein